MFYLISCRPDRPLSMVNNSKSTVPYTPSPTPQPGQDPSWNLKQAAAAQSIRPYSSSRLGQLPSLTAGIAPQASGTYSSAAASPTASFVTAHSNATSMGGFEPDKSGSGRTRISMHHSSGGGGESGWAGPPPLRPAGSGAPVGEGVEMVGTKGSELAEQQGQGVPAMAGSSSDMGRMGRGAQRVSFEEGLVAMPTSSSSSVHGSSWGKRPLWGRGVAEGIESGEGNELTASRGQLRSEGLQPSFTGSVGGASDDEEPDLVSVGLAGINRGMSFADVRASTGAAGLGGVGSGGGGSGNVSRRLTPTNSWRELNAGVLSPTGAGAAVLSAVQTGTTAGTAGGPVSGSPLVGSNLSPAPSGSPVRSGPSYGGMGSISGGRRQWLPYDIASSAGSGGQTAGAAAMDPGSTTPHCAGLPATPSQEIQAAPTLGPGFGSDLTGYSADPMLPRIYSRSRSFGNVAGMDTGDGWGAPGGASPFVAMSRTTTTEAEVPLVRWTVLFSLGADCRQFRKARDSISELGNGKQLQVVLGHMMQLRQGLFPYLPTMRLWK
jgi:hypothetical protein